MNVVYVSSRKENLRHGRKEVESLLRDVLLELSEWTDDAFAAYCREAGRDLAVVAGDCAEGRHMANPVTLPKTAATVTKAGLNCPVIITPMDFLERKEEFGL